MSSELDRQGLVDIFVIEASEALEVLRKAFHPSDETTATPAQLQEQGLTLMGALLESTLEEAPSIEASLWPKALEIIRGIVTSLESQLKVVASGGAEDPAISARWKCDVAGLFSSLPTAAPLDKPTLLAPDYLVPTLDAEVLSYFAPEADEYLETMESLLQRLRQDPADGETIHALYRTAHTLKGSACTIGFTVIGDIAHPVENCMSAVREGQVSL